MKQHSGRNETSLQAQKAVAEANLALAKLDEEELEEDAAKKRKSRRGRLDQSPSPALMQQFMEEGAKGDAGVDTGVIHNDMSIEFGDARLPALLMNDMSTS